MAISAPSKYLFVDIDFELYVVIIKYRSKPLNTAIISYRVNWSRMWVYEKVGLITEDQSAFSNLEFF